MSSGPVALASDPRPAGATTLARAGAVDEVVVLDYGGQYSQLIARRVRECGVFSELLPHHVGIDAIRERAPRALILSGGPASVYAADAPHVDPGLLDLGIPAPAIGHGMQALVHELGGRVEGAEVGEFGRSQLTVLEPGRLLAGLPKEQTCWMSHRDTVFEAPPGFTALASSTASPVAAVEAPGKGIYGIQFHPEVVHTPYGRDILTTFLSDIAGCALTWSPASIIDEQIAAIRAQVGEGRVICGLSGGVDSSVAALLVHRAVGDQLTCVFVDHGSDAQERRRPGRGGLPRRLPKGPWWQWMPLERFLASPPSASGDPSEEAQAHRSVSSSVSSRRKRPVLEGALASSCRVPSTPDVIERGAAPARRPSSPTTTSAGLPADLRVRPRRAARALFKDEVRAVGAQLGSPERLVWRQPFPGPGLGDSNSGRGGDARATPGHVARADATSPGRDPPRRVSIASCGSRFCCPALDVRTVGVQGRRAHLRIRSFVIRAVTSDDAMTADWARLPYDLLDDIALLLAGDTRGLAFSFGTEALRDL